MIRLEEVSSKNVWEIIKLEVNEDQKDFVASNTESIIEAYLATKANGNVFPFGIYDDDLLVGFVMISYDKDDYWDSDLEIIKKNYYIWRFMIDKRYQKNGYGFSAMQQVLKYIKGFPCGMAEYCFLSYEPNNIGAKRLYQSLGFEETSLFDGDEQIAIMKL